MFAKWGEKEAFFDGMEHVKEVEERELGEYKLVGDIECLRRKFVGGELGAADIFGVLAVLYTTYSTVENHTYKLLSRIEEYSETTRNGRPMIKPEHLDKHVIQPLKQRLEKIRVVVRGEIG